MRLRTTAVLATAALGLAIPASGLAQGTTGMGAGAGMGTVARPDGGGARSTTIGTGRKTCVLRPGARCRGVAQPWAVEYHGPLQRAKFTKADLQGANFRGADLSGADFRGANVRLADFRGANLQGARFDTLVYNSRAWQDRTWCAPYCGSADLFGANLRDANLTTASLAGANLTGASLINANLTGSNLMMANLTASNLLAANLSGANVSGANLTSASLNTTNLTNANLVFANVSAATFYAIWGNTTCPDGTVTNTGC